MPDQTTPPATGPSPRLDPAPPVAAQPRPRRVRTAARAAGALLPGIAAVAAGWTLDSTWTYLLGVAALAAGVLTLLRNHRWVATGAAVAVLVVGVAGPWVAIQRAYAEDGAEVSAWTPATPVPSDDDLHRFASETVTALDGDGAEAWFSPVEMASALRVVPVADGRLLVRTTVDDVLLGPDGRTVWSAERTADAAVVAADGDVLVERTCARVEGTETCTWTGRDLADGSTAWSVTRPYALAASRPADGRGSGVAVQPTTTLFATASGDTTEVRAAGSGAVVQTVPAGPVVWLAGDVVLVLDDADAPDCTLTASRDGGRLWESPVDCAVGDAIRATDLGVAGFATGRAAWTATTPDGRTFVVDLDDGTVQERAGYHALGASPYGDGGEDDLIVVGAGVQVTSGPDGVVVADAADGARLWTVDLPASDVRSLQADGALVVVQQYHRPLLLHEWFAPDDPGTVTTTVRDARTGEVRGGLRHDPGLDAPALSGNRVLVRYDGRDGERTARLLGG